MLMRGARFTSLVVVWVATIAAQTFNLKESFSVAHPQQVVRFAHSGGYVAPRTHKVVGPSSSEVAFQWTPEDGGGILVQTNLPSGADYTWTLSSIPQSGTPSVTNPVTIDRTGTYLELSNGLTGVRVRASQGTPWNKSPYLEFRKEGGTWFSVPDSTFRSLYTGGSTINYMTGYEAHFREVGPLRSQIEIRYTSNNPEYTYGATPLVPAGPGYYNIILTLDAGRNSIVVTEEANLWAFYDIDFTAGLLPNQARYRGHSSSSTTCGYILNPGPVVYPPAHSRNEMDAYQDISYSSTRTWGWNCDATMRRGLFPWYGSASPDAGRYWQVYNTADGSSGDVFGIYTGRLSKCLNCGRGPSLPGLGTTNTSRAMWTIPIHAARTQDGSGLASSAREFGLYFGTKANMPSNVESTSQIGLEQNIYGGINLTKLAAYSLTFTDPEGGFPYLYLTTTQGNDLVSRFANGTADCGSSSCLYSKYSGDTEQVLLHTLWRNQNSAAVEAILSSARTYSTAAMNTFANLGGVTGKTYNYWQFGSDALARLDMVYEVMRGSWSSSAQKSEAKAHLAFWASVLWDNDFVPIENESGDSYGTANMPVQYKQQRSMFAHAIPQHSLMTTRQTNAKQHVDGDYALAMNSSGSGADSTHYQGAFVSYLLKNLLAKKQNGTFSVTDFSRLYLYPNWEASILSPPEPRFGGTMRKVYSNGDGATESVERPGAVATLLDGVSTAGSQLSSWTWHQMNSSTRYTHYNTSSAIYDKLTQAAPSGSMTQFNEGYHTNLRSGFGTAKESSIWFINGNFYHDHRHSDAGQTTMYALGAPLGIDWNPNLYSPHVPGSYMHNVITKVAALAAAWDSDNTALTEGAVGSTTGGWGPTSAQSYGGYDKAPWGRATFTRVDGSTWTRTVQLAAGNQTYPIIRIRDTFGDSDAKVLTWNLMATGAVDAPGGSYTPTTRLQSTEAGTATVFPSNGTTRSLTATALNRFGFTGQTWAAHATGGINWDVYVIPSAAASFLIGNWGHVAHPTREKTEYLAANGSSFSEKQHILRVNSTGSFETIILPWRKTEAPTQTVTQQSCGVQIVRGSETECISDSAYIYTDGTTQILTSFDGTSKTAHGMTISGPAECVKTAAAITCRAQALSSTTATVTLPEGWIPQQPTAISGSEYVLYANSTGQTYSFAQSGSPRSVPFAGSGDLTIDGNVIASGSATLRMLAGTYSARWGTGPQFSLVIP